MSGQWQADFLHSLAQHGQRFGYSCALTGTGSVLGVLTVSTTLAIGNSPGTVTFEHDLMFGTGTTYLFELVGGTTGPLSADLGNVAVTLILGTAILDLAQAGAGVYTPGDKFTLFSYAGILSGTFARLMATKVP
ncbi:MAG: hypothetical protein NTW21_22135 [Verrucomicrobia bacterium]|nr:hypothetical protein [Verrucomicrobiota bacterium]